VCRRRDEKAEAVGRQRKGWSSRVRGSKGRRGKQEKGRSSRGGVGSGGGGALGASGGVSLEGTVDSLTWIEGDDED
jgi:hypothetical protein